MTIFLIICAAFGLFFAAWGTKNLLRSAEYINAVKFCLGDEWEKYWDEDYILNCYFDRNIPSYWCAHYLKDKKK